MMILAFAALALALFSLPLRRLNVAMGIPVFSLVFASLALLGAFFAAILSLPTLLLCVVGASLALWLTYLPALPSWKPLGSLLLALLALTAALHWWPGIQNPLLLPAQQLTNDAIPYTLYANFDKGWAGYCLLLALWPTQRAISRSAHGVVVSYWQTLWRGLWPAWPVTVLLALALASMLGLIKLAPKWPDFLLLFVFCNLLLTCVAEEAFFRGLLQRPLQQHLAARGINATTAAWLAIVLVSVLFGVAHFAGGWAYVLVATLASLGYGWAYQRSGRIEVAILAHFGLNLLHLTLFTYPMLIK